VETLDQAAWTERIGEAFVAAFPRAETPRIDRMRPVAVGEHDELWRFRMRWREPDGGGEAELALRVGLDDQGREICLREARALRLAAAQELRVPAVWLASGGKGPSFVVADWIEGEPFGVAWRRRREDASAEVLAELIVDLHERTNDRPTATAAGTVGDALSAIRRRIEEHEDEEAEAELDELVQSRPKNVRAALCHGDFRTAKVLMEKPARGALVGWGQAGYGDPRLDLARAVINLDRDHGGALRAPFLRLYRGTRPVEPNDLAWFERLVRLEERLGRQPASEAAE
jgi:aminoglycoside phosphotransferase (APT) family kinase protein